MKRLAAAALIAGGMLVASVSTASAVTAGKLNEWCLESDTSRFFEGICGGYIIAGSDFSELGKGFCRPSGVLPRQVIDIVKKWLVENPSAHHLPALFTIAEALKKPFPCK